MNKTNIHFCPRGAYILVDYVENEQNVLVQCIVC